jgi:hypothetical protein
VKSLGRIKYIVYVTVVAQLVYLGIYSNRIFNSGSLSWDSSLYIQPWWLISKGNFWPYSTTLRAPFFGNHGELIVWLLGLIGFIFRSPLSLLLIQDLAFCLTEIVVLIWISEIVFKNENHGGFGYRYYKNYEFYKKALFVFAFLILLFNPWNYWALGADFHVEPIATLFLVVTGRYIYLKDRKYLLGMLGVLLCGQVASIWLIGLALSTFLTADRLKVGIKVLFSGLIWYFLLGFLGADQSNTVSEGYAYLTSNPTSNVSSFTILIGGLLHINRLFSKIFGRIKDVWAYISAPGLIGIVSPWGFGVTVVILLMNLGNNYRNGVFAFPGFQGMPIGFFMTVGLCDTAMRALAYPKKSVKIEKARLNFKAKVSLLLVSLMTLISIGWGLVWIPQVQSNWLKVDPKASASIVSALKVIPVSDEVLVSQGITGLFATRYYVYPIRKLGCFPVNTATVWMVLTSNEGIETLTTEQTLGILNYAIFDMGAQVIQSSNNIWLLQLKPVGASMCFNNTPNDMTGSFLPSDIGTPVIGNTVGNSYMYSPGGRSGYVTYGAYVRSLPNTRVTASVTLSSFQGVSVQMWDDSTNTIIAQLEPDFNGITTQVLLQGTVSGSSLDRSNEIFNGKFIFEAKHADAPKGDLIEIRVYNSGSSPVKVYGIRFTSS